MINHYAAIQIRVLGDGNLRPRMYTIGANDVEVYTKTLVPIEMSITTDKSPVVLANVKKEQIFLELKTTEISEYFVINRIDLFMKPTATSGPQ